MNHLAASCGRTGRAVRWSLAGAGAAGFLAFAGALAPRPAGEPAPFIVGNEAVGWDQIRPRLAEIAGAQAVEEVTLEHQLREQFRLNGLTLDEADVARERDLFSLTLRRANPGGDEMAAGQALMRVRRARGLGPERFDAMLRRSAMLRKLVAPEVAVSEDDVRASMNVRFGPRVRCSIIVLGAEDEARRLHQRLSAAAPEELASRFAAEARLLSVDPSGAGGGAIEPVSPADPTYAAAFRDVVRDLPPGSLSPVIVFDRGYAVVLIGERVPGVEPPPGAEREARDDVRQRTERAAMDRLATRLLTSASVTVFDPGLNWSWSARGAP